MRKVCDGGGVVKSVLEARFSVPKPCRSAVLEGGKRRLATGWKV